ncbi:23S ribosomal RNA methyltransferase Erm [Agromyces italicus]|uniref:23S ribosomal RNA methyltransferase Erm n=1 Tax=Agromyces italicus TaxID=279572 RepID=UPI0003B4404C|nr:23S ribosomal RNA methyltransferase Erm [Agromyces italicus]
MRTREHPSTRHPVPTGHGGRQELGQNFLVDRGAIDRLVGLVDETRGPIIELGAGGGALTDPLARLGRPLTALELDPGRVASLRRRFGARVTVEQADVLRWRYPSAPHVVVGNVPFHLTTAILRSLLDRPGWTNAVLLTQWEVARRRCGVGGSSLLTAQSAPWFEFALDGRVPARAFRPVPAVDGGLFSVRRRAEPLVEAAERRGYCGFVAAAFRGRGRGMAQILTRTPRPMGAAQAKSWLARRGLARDVLPGRLSAEDWASLWQEVRRG